MTNERIPSDNAERPSSAEDLSVQSRWYDAHIDDINPDALNNLHLWLPFSEYVTQLEEFPAILDKKHDDNPHGLHSAKYMSQTPREFIHAIADAVDALPGLREQLNQLSERHARGEEVRPLLLELYKTLRRQGYSHYDLVS